MIFDQGTLGPVQIAWALAPPGRAHRFATGRLLLAELVPALRTDAATVERRCARCGGDHGRVRVVGAPYAVSISYAGEMVVAAAVLLAAASALGIDVEPRSEDVDAPLTELAGLFAPRTPPGLRCWTQIEAVVKADGRGLDVPPADVAFEGPSASLLPGGRAARVPGNSDRFEVASAPGPAGYIVSAAVAPASAAL